MTGGASLWRANWSERSDPFADVSRAQTRGPGWQRAAAERGYISFADRVAESTAAFRSSHLKPSPLAGEGDSPKASGVRGFGASAPRESRASAVTLGNPGRTDIEIGQRVFHSKFGYGTVAEIEGNKLEIDFEHSGRKRVLDSFVSVPT